MASTDISKKGCHFGELFIPCSECLYKRKQCPLVVMVQEEAIEKIHEYLKAHFWEHIEPDDKVDAKNILALVESLGYVQLDS